MANSAGPQSWTGTVPGNPALGLPFNMNIISCPTITAGNTAVTGCSNFMSGNLQPLVIGGSGPYSFSQTGVSTCTGITLNASGIFSYNAATGFTGPCSFNYSVLK